MSAVPMIVVLVVSMVLCAVMPRPAQAHRVRLFAWVENGMVHAKGGFGGKKVAKHCALKAFDDTHTMIFQGQTDDTGCCQFKVPDGYQGDMHLELDAGPGHKGLWTVAAQELQTGAATPAEEIAHRHENFDTDADPIRLMIGIGAIFSLALIGRALKKQHKKRTLRA